MRASPNAPASRLPVGARRGYPPAVAGRGLPAETNARSRSEDEEAVRVQEGLVELQQVRPIRRRVLQALSPDASNDSTRDRHATLARLRATGPEGEGAGSRARGTRIAVGCNRRRPTPDRRGPAPSAKLCERTTGATEQKKLQRSGIAGGKPGELEAGERGRGESFSETAPEGNDDLVSTGGLSSPKNIDLHADVGDNHPGRLHFGRLPLRDTSRCRFASHEAR